MHSPHQLLSPPPSDRERSVSISPRHFGKMPVDYAIKTDIKPIVRDFRTGTVIDPGGAGDKYVVNRRGKRVPYEIVPDGTPSPLSKRRFKTENAAYERLQTLDIKSDHEDEDDGGERTLTTGNHGNSWGRSGSSRQRAAQSMAPPRPTTPCPSTRGRMGKPQAWELPSDGDSSHGAGSSSSDESSSDEDDTSDETSSSSSMNTSIVDVSSVFRPSKSPSRFADTPASATRSRSRVKQAEDRDLDAPSTSSPLTKKNPPSQATSVTRPPSSSLYFPIRQTDCQSCPSSRLPPHPPAPVVPELTVSPASPRGHGWNPINKQKKTSKSSKSRDHGEKPSDPSDVRLAPTAPAAMLASGQHCITASRHERAATAGPSSGRHGSGPVQSPPVHSSQKSKGYRFGQISSQLQSSLAFRSPKGKGKGTATVMADNDAETHDVELLESVNFKLGTSKNEANALDKNDNKHRENEEKRRRLKKNQKRRTLRAKKKAEKQQVNVQAAPYKRYVWSDREDCKDTCHLLHHIFLAEASDLTLHHNRHGPPRQARIERSIEETPGRGLPTPDPSSSATGHTSVASQPPPTRFEGMFMTSPVQPATPGPSSQQAPPSPLSPKTPSPTSQYCKKRSRSIYENPGESLIHDVATQICGSLERKIEEMQAEERLGRERLEERMESDRVERQRFENGWEDQCARTRREDREERERFALILEEKVSRDRRQDEGEWKRLGKSVAEHETRITTLQGQTQGQTERLESRIDGQASRLSTLQGQVDGQRARSNIFGSRLENQGRKLDELSKRMDELVRLGLINQEINNTRLQHLETATFPAGETANQNQKYPAPRVHIREVQPREFYDFSGRRKGFIANTLIRSDHGKSNPRTLPPRPPRNTSASGSSSPSRSAQPIVQISNAVSPGGLDEGTLPQNRLVHSMSNSLLPCSSHCYMLIYAKQVGCRQVH